MYFKVTHVFISYAISISNSQVWAYLQIDKFTDWAHTERKYIFLPTRETPKVYRKH